ncbi:hypothetical protein ACQEVF_58000 [Nonomuraea polychroma]|uniref:hypothetical protein n=1 Tax=Nonomuraea polychroma TaxID=46176 RepID=UPI003D8F91CA
MSTPKEQHADRKVADAASQLARARAQIPWHAVPLEHDPAADTLNVAGLLIPADVLSAFTARMYATAGRRPPVDLPTAYLPSLSGRYASPDGTWIVGPDGADVAVGVNTGLLPQPEALRFAAAITAVCQQIDGDPDPALTQAVADVLHDNRHRPAPEVAARILTLVRDKP